MPRSSYGLILPFPLWVTAAGLGDGRGGHGDSSSHAVPGLPLVPVCNWERHSQVVPLQMLPPQAPLAVVRARGGGSATTVTRHHSMSLLVPRDSGIWAGLGREEGQKPLPCQKETEAAAACHTGGELLTRAGQRPVSRHPSVPLRVSHDLGRDTFPVTYKEEEEDDE